MSELISVFNQSIIITLFVFAMMLLTDYINVFTKGRMKEAIKGGIGRQYVVTSFLGATPGCLGAFMAVSLYVHGLLSFGAIAGGMIATSGDEAFVMLALFPEKAIFLFILLFVLGIIGAWLSDKIASRIGIIPCKECKLQVVHPGNKYLCFEPTILKRLFKLSSLRYAILLFSAFITLTVPDHYLNEHIWHHIIKRHLWRVFLWTFFALLIVKIGLAYWNLEAFVKSNITLVFLICTLVGLIPESGPHMVFVMMFANGIIPFSVLLTNSIIQDGHGILPLLSYSVKDALMIKIFNFVFAIAIGLPLLLLGW